MVSFISMKCQVFLCVCVCVCVCVYVCVCVCVCVWNKDETISLISICWFSLQNPKA